VGDLILGVDGKVIKDPRELQRIIAEIDIGKSVEVSILREKEKRTVKVQIGEMPAS
jgi:serine protease Do